MRTQTIGIFVFDGLMALDAVGPFEVLSKLPDSLVRLISIQPGIVTCTGSMKLLGDYTIMDDIDLNVVVIPGGCGIQYLLQNIDVLTWIKRIHDYSTYTISVCTESLLLGAAGLLNGIKAKTHWNHIDKRKKYCVIPIKNVIFKMEKSLPPPVSQLELIWL